MVDRSQAETMAVTDRRRGTDDQSVATLLPGASDQIEAIAGRGERGGVPTGFVDLEAIVHGLHPGQMVVGARPGVGKSPLGLDGRTGRRLGDLDAPPRPVGSGRQPGGGS